MSTLPRVNENRSPSYSVLLVDDPTLEGLDAKTDGEKTFGETSEGLATQVFRMESQVIRAFKAFGIKVSRCSLQTSIKECGKYTVSVPNGENAERMEKWLKDTKRYDFSAVRDPKNTRYFITF